MARQQPSPFPEIMSSGDVADLLHVSYQYVERLAKEGRIASQQIGSGRVFLRKDVLAFKKQRDEKAKTDARIKRKR